MAFALVKGKSCLVDCRGYTWTFLDRTVLQQCHVEQLVGLDGSFFLSIPLDTRRIGKRVPEIFKVVFGLDPPVSYILCFRWYKLGRPIVASQGHFTPSTTTALMQAATDSQQT